MKMITKESRHASYEAGQAIGLRWRAKFDAWLARILRRRGKR